MNTPESDMCSLVRSSAFSRQIGFRAGRALSPREVGCRLATASLLLAFLAFPVFGGLPRTTSESAPGEAERLAARLHREALELHEQERWGAAEELYRRAVSEARALPEDHATRLDIQLGLARLLLERGEAAAAEPLLRIAAMRLSARGVPDWRAAEASSLLGASLAARGHAKEAQVLLKKGFAALNKSLGASDPRSRRALSRLADFYRADDEASEEEEAVLLVEIFAEEDSRVDRQ